MELSCQKSGEAIIFCSFFSKAGEGLNIERFWKLERLERIAMKADNFMKDESWSQEAGVELRDNAGALSKTPASESGKNDRQESEKGLLEEILTLKNLNLAYKRVKGNGGSCGIDGMKVEELQSYLKQHGKEIRQSILEGRYKPQAVRRVEIPKPEGGVRQLGIPSVVDRVIQQAIAQVLNGIFEPNFSGNSYGFRGGKSAHQAIEAARKYIEEGNRWTVDLDLEKFSLFDEGALPIINNQMIRPMTITTRMAKMIDIKISFENFFLKYLLSIDKV